MPPESAIATQIRTALAKHLKRDVSKVRVQDNLREDLGLDSLAMLEMVFEVEEAFNLEIPDDDLSRITTVGDVVAYVEARLAGATPAPAAASPPATGPAKKKAPRRA
jgi:acyl carrier protein